MKLSRSFALLGVVVLAVASASAQLIHISYDGTFQQTTPPFVHNPQVFGDPVPFHADVYFDAQVTVQMNTQYGITNFETGAPPYDLDGRNFIRWKFDGQQQVLSLASLMLFEDGRFLASWNARIPYFSLVLFLDPATPLNTLPVPPFSLAPRNGSFGIIDAGFSIAGNFIQGPITNVTAELIPLPEPATYAMFGAAGLLALAALRHRRKVSCAAA